MPCLNDGLKEGGGIGGVGRPSSYLRAAEARRGPTRRLVSLRPGSARRRSSANVRPEQARALTSADAKAGLL